jgi:K+-sensing histidine kinase KdpD
MPTVPSSLLLRYALAVIVVVAVVLSKWLLDPLIGSEMPLLLFLGAVMVSAWYGGLWPGMVTAGLSAFAAHFFFVEPVANTAGLSYAADYARVTLFLLEGALIAWLAESLHSASRRAERLRCEPHGVRNGRSPNRRAAVPRRRGSSTDQ